MSRITVTVEILDNEFEKSDVTGLAECLQSIVTQALWRGAVYAYHNPDGKLENWYVPAVSISVTTE